jgi:RNA polymerase sigma factor for flagellar operon FliA
MSEAPEELLPPYAGIKMGEVRLVVSEADAAEALAAFSSMDAVGFDTESKPTFQKGEESTGPHLVQLATDDVAYLFQVGRPAVAAAALFAVRSVLESATILKVGFGLGDDLRRLRGRFGIEPANVLDLSTALRRGERNTLGAKTAVARYFGQRLQKSKRITTTNWALPTLSEKQILYAADDAHVALRVYRRWRELQTT